MNNEEIEIPKPKISIRPVRKDFSGSEIGPWKILQYVHHLNTSPIWRAQCQYCDRIWDASMPKIKRKKECECEDTLKFTTSYISNSIFRWYLKNIRKEKEACSLKYNDMYKIFLRQDGKDLETGEDLIFDYGINYANDPITCNYIWPDLCRNSKANSYNLNNCYFKNNNKQRFPRKRGNHLKKLEKMGRNVDR